MLLASLFIAIPAASPVSGQESGQISAFARANPLRTEILAMRHAVHGCHRLTVVVKTVNLGQVPVSKFEHRLHFDEGAFQLVTQHDIGRDLVRGGRKFQSVFVLEPEQDGNFVIVASGHGVIDGEPVASESQGEIVTVRSCGS